MTPDGGPVERRGGGQDEVRGDRVTPFKGDSRSVTVHKDSKENRPCVTGVVWKITSVASGTVHTTCVHVNVCSELITSAVLTCSDV